MQDEHHTHEQECQLLDSELESGEESSSPSNTTHDIKFKAHLWKYRWKCFGKCLTSLCNPGSLAYRYVMLAVICLSKICVAYSVDLPAALEHTIINVMRVSVTEYELLYSLFSFPNIVLLIIGGVVIDRVLGLRLALVIFVILACVGQFLFAMGAFVGQFWLMGLGRFVFGSGVELASVALDTFVAALFRDRELSFVFGIVYGANRISSTINFNSSPGLYSLFKFLVNNNVRLGSVLLFAFCLCLVGFGLALLAIVLDKKREKVTETRSEKRGQFKIADLKDFSSSFWILIIIGMLYYIPVFPFVSIAQVFYEKKYSYTVSTAGLVNGIVYVVPALTYPLMGLLFDWTGYKLFWGMLLILGTQACHYAFAFTGPVFIVPIIGSLSLGTIYCMFTAAVWPLVFLLVQEHQMATAYGVYYASYELGQAVSSLIVGAIVDNLGYFVVELFFINILSLALILTIVLYIVDATLRDQILNMSGRRRRKLAKQNKRNKRYSVEQHEPELENVVQIVEDSTGTSNIKDSEC